MTRYFIGLMVPSGIREEVYAFAKSLQDTISTDQKSRPVWNDPTDLHCTLLFIGRYPDEQELARYVEQVARKLPPVTLILVGRMHWLGRNSLFAAETQIQVHGTK